MSAAPLVSVIIPSYNYGPLLPEAVASALSQRTDGLDVEVIVVDDGSTDNTPEVAGTLGGGVVYIRQKNQGLAAARNTGLRAARGDYAAFLDADDLYAEHLLAGQVQVFAENPDLDMVICRCVEKKEGAGVLHMWPLVSSHWDVHSCHANLAPVHCHLTRMGLVRRAGFFDTALKSCEDHDFWLRCHGLGARVGVNPLGLVIYRKHGDNMTHNAERMFFHDALMHIKVHGMLADLPAYPSDKLGGWLAHAAACLFSTEVMAFNKNMSDKMQDLFVQAVRHVASMVRGGRGETDAQLLRIRSYYVAKCLLLALPMEERLAPEAVRAVMILRHLFPEIGQLAPQTLEARTAKHYARLCLSNPLGLRRAD
ncbi:MULTISPECIES: glycosyltransferase family 2 protein [Desulfovibrio]|uniref:Glycosyl transferase family 2 n=2 Tax=Desulfovibrio TaxID=872 RepID=A0AA94L2E4_DESDE|nr:MULTISPECIES: glycosyltransferase [Desulfovibrio]SFW52296.1 Glycosyl transferase family 2 [Desulfovibrio desulfuricans]SPD36242.1 Glycosyl transferase family 2 [Desulfovibrio sp. G11]